MNFRSDFVFSRAQARRAPRAHVRELLCAPQSSKERLRRSRTESSGAAPAIEELPGEARQVRPDRAACGFVSTDSWPSHGRGGLEGVRLSSSHIFGLAAAACLSPPLPTAYHRSRNFPPRYRFRLSGRSGGRPALQFPRASNPCGSSNIRLRPDRVPQKLEFLAPVLSLLSVDVRRADRPPDICCSCLIVETDTSRIEIFLLSGPYQDKISFSRLATCRRREPGVSSHCHGQFHYRI